MCCELCEIDRELTSHHLIPREVHSKNWCKKKFSRQEMKSRRANLCKLCHKALHNFFTNRELAEKYNEVSKLLNSEKVIKHIKWVKKIK